MPDLLSGTHIKTIGGLKSVQIAAPPGVYFLTLNGIIVYVGQSKKPMQRIATHLSEGVKTFDGAYIRHCPEAELDQLESFFIHALEPAYNCTMPNGEFVAPESKARSIDVAKMLCDHSLIGRDNKILPKRAKPNASPVVHQEFRQGRLLRLYDVIEITGIKKSTIYDGVKSGDFPKPVKLSKRAVAWRDDDIQRWIESRSLVPGVGIEPTPLSGPDFESGASTNFTTRAAHVSYSQITGAHRP